MKIKLYMKQIREIFLHKFSQLEYNLHVPWTQNFPRLIFNGHWREFDVEKRAACAENFVESTFQQYAARFSASISHKDELNFKVLKFSGSCGGEVL